MSLNIALITVQTRFVTTKNLFIKNGKLHKFRPKTETFLTLS